MSKQEFAPVVPYFAASGGGSKLDQLRRRVGVGEKEVADAADWSQRTRREAELGVVRRELEALEHAAQQSQQESGTVVKQEAAAPCTLDDLVASGHYIKSGNMYLQVRNKPTKAPATAQPARQREAQQYAAHQPYFDAEAQA